MGAEIGGSLVCDGGEVTLGAPGRARAVDLRMVTLGRALSLRKDFLAGEGALVALDGLRYPVVPRGGMSPADWTAFLRNRMEYAAQPYRQLADVYNAAGMEEHARRFLIAQQDDLLHSGTRLSLPEHLRLHVLRFGLGYGYQTWRALVGLGLTILLAMCLAVSAAQTTDAVGVPPNLANPATHQPRPGEFRQCSVIDQLGLGLELAIPLLSTTTRLRCNFVSTKDTGEQLVVGAGWILQFLGWAFATLFVSGYTTLIRKT